MATHPRDGKAEVTVSEDKRIPLKSVCFRELTSIPGVTSTMVTVLTAGERRVMDGKDWLPPPMWFDPVQRLIKIEDRCYPLERVHYFERAVAAITKKPPPLDLTKYTVGQKPQ